MPKQPEYLDDEDGTRILLTEDDVPELGVSFARNARPLRESFPELAAYAEKRKAGRPKSAAPKQVKSFKLSPDVIAAITASGRGYNTRVEAALRAALAEGRI